MDLTSVRWHEGPEDDVLHRWIKAHTRSVTTLSELFRARARHDAANVNRICDLLDGSDDDAAAMSKMASIRALKEKLGLELSAHLRMQAKLMTQLHDNVLPVVAGADGSTSAGGASSDGGGGDGGDDDASSDGATAAAPSAGEDAKTTVKRENGGSIALERPKRQRAAAVASRALQMAPRTPI